MVWMFLTCQGLGQSLGAQMRKRTGPCMWEKCPSSTWESLEYVRRTITFSLTYLFPDLSLPHLFSCTSCPCCLLISVKAQNHPFSRKSSQTALSAQQPITPAPVILSAREDPFPFLPVCLHLPFLVDSHFFGEQAKARRHRERKEAAVPSHSRCPSGKPQVPVFSLATRELKRTYRVNGSLPECVVKLDGSTGYPRYRTSDKTIPEVVSPASVLCSLESSPPVQPSRAHPVEPYSTLGGQGTLKKKDK